MSREMEDRLRAAFDAKASRVTQASVSHGEPPRDGDEPSDGAVVDIGHRRRWIAPMLAAAAVIAIAVGTTAVVTAVRADRDHNSPAHTPTPDAHPDRPTSAGAESFDIAEFIRKRIAQRHRVEHAVDARRSRRRRSPSRA